MRRTYWWHAGLLRILAVMERLSHAGQELSSGYRIGKKWEQATYTNIYLWDLKNWAWSAAVEDSILWRHFIMREEVTDWQVKLHRTELYVFDIRKLTSQEHYSWEQLRSNKTFAYTNLGSIPLPVGAAPWTPQYSLSHIGILANATFPLSFRRNRNSLDCSVFRSRPSQDQDMKC